MEFQPGNKLWQVRSTHGRDTLITSPRLLWDAFVEYCEWMYDNPIEEQDFVGKDAEEVTRKHVAPFGIKSFAVFIGASESWWRNFKKTDTVANDPDFLTVIERIEDVVYIQKFEGAAVGLYNANLISRELGIRDKVDVDHTSKGEKIDQAAQTVIVWGGREIKV